MISAVGLTLQFGERYLFDDISFRIGPHDRIGLVGSNGAGKSTLLRVLTGTQCVDEGKIEKAKYVNTGYLPQEGMYSEGKTLYREVESAFGDILALQARLEQVQQQMGELNHESEEFQEILEIYGELQHQLEQSDVFRLKSKIEKILMGLGFSETDLERQTDEFSGGWQMRIALAKLLLIQPSLLLLDEPTNHLDLDSLQWLEQYLQSYEGAVIIVSHDRRFLNTMTSKTFELSRGIFTEYAGNYAFYVVAKAERKEQQLAAMRNQQQQIKQTEQFIDRFRYKATKARQVQSRIKQLEKLDIIEIEDEEQSIHFDFPPAPQSGRIVMELHNIHKSYGPGTPKVFDGIDFEIERGDKIAFVGVNGAGKSTLSRIIAGVEPFDKGERKIGHNVAISYFAQHQAEELRLEATALNIVDEEATGEIRKKLRTLLGCFLFRGDDVFKQVKVLSGGEKSRLALARILLHPSNLIVLDEPTNHLDMRSKDVLQEALKHYAGSFIIVSHDRDFIDPLVNKVVEFRRGSIKTYLGTLSDYLYKKQQEMIAATPSLDNSRSIKSSTTDKGRKRLEAEERQVRYKKLKPIQDKIATLEKSIAELEHRKLEIEELMSHPDFYKNGEQAKQVATEFKELGTKLTDAYYKWGELAKNLERTEQEMKK
jgi:ATP-binding cassette subfamily F protein 3